MFIFRQRALFNTRVYALLLIGITVLLSGCASNINIAKQISKQKNVSEQEGILTARVINTTSYQLPLNRLYIAPKEVNTSKEVKPILAYAENRPIGDSTLFAVSLPPGEYSISVVSSFVMNGNFYYQRGAAIDPEFGVFVVEAGKVTDLGTMVYYPKPMDDKYKDILVRIPETAGGELLTRYFPQYSDKAENALTWEADDRDEERFLNYAAIAQNPVDFAKIVEAPNGGVYILSKLGVILKYTPDESFETYAVDSDLVLKSFDANSSGDLLVGGHEGALFFMPANNEGEWQQIEMPQKSTIHHLSFYQENQFDVVFSVDKTVTVARYNVEDFALVDTLNEYTYTQKWSNMDASLQNEIDKDKGKKKAPKPKEIKNVFVSDDEKNEISISSLPPNRWSYFGTGQRESFAYSPDTWEMRKSDDDDESMDIVINAGAVKLGIKMPGFWSWTGRPEYFSRGNESQAWRKVNSHILYCKNDTEVTISGNCKEGEKFVKAKRKTFSFRSKPWFYNVDEGLAITTFSDVSFWSGQRSTETKIVKTKDGGNTWFESDISLPKEYCSGLITEVKDRILLSCEGSTSDFYESSDFGETWQHVRQQQAF